MIDPIAVELHEDEAPTLGKGDRAMTSAIVEFDDEGNAEVVEQGDVYVEGADGVLHVYRQS